MSTEDEPIAEILQRHKDEGLVQIGREALADAQATSIVGMDHDAIVTRATRLELALGYVLGAIDHTCADRDTLKAEMEQLRAAKRHLSERISTGQEGWNELHREAEQLRAERDALKATISDVLCRMATTRAWAYRELAGDARSNVHRVIDHLWGILDPDRSIHPALAIPETSGADDGYVDRHGRSWDPHPFVQSRAIDNVAVCICGQPPEHQIHAPETPGDAETEEANG